MSIAAFCYYMAVSDYHTVKIRYQMALKKARRTIAGAS